MEDNDKLIEEYCEMVDNYAWYRKGDINDIAKVARILGRDYFMDIAEHKRILIDSIRQRQEQEQS